MPQSAIGREVSGFASGVPPVAGSASGFPTRVGFLCSVVEPVPPENSVLIDSTALTVIARSKPST